MMTQPALGDTTEYLTNEYMYEQAAWVARTHKAQNLMRKHPHLEADDLIQHLVLRVQDRIAQGHVPQYKTTVVTWMEQAVVDLIRYWTARKRWPKSDQVFSLEGMMDRDIEGTPNAGEGEFDLGQQSDAYSSSPEFFGTVFGGSDGSLDDYDEVDLVLSAIDLVHDPDGQRRPFLDQVLVFLETLWPGRAAELLHKALLPRGSRSRGNGDYNLMAKFRARKLTSEVGYIEAPNGYLYLLYGDHVYRLENWDHRVDKLMRPASNGKYMPEGCTMTIHGALREILEEWVDAGLLDAGADLTELADELLDALDEGEGYEDVDLALRDWEPEDLEWADEEELPF